MNYIGGGGRNNHNNDDDNEEGQRRADGIPPFIRFPTPERERGAEQLRRSSSHHQQHHHGSNNHSGNGDRPSSNSSNHHPSTSHAAAAAASHHGRSVSFGNTANDRRNASSYSHKSAATAALAASSSQGRPAVASRPQQPPQPSSSQPPSYTRHSAVATAHQRAKHTDATTNNSNKPLGIPAHGYHAQQQQEARKLQQQKRHNHQQRIMKQQGPMQQQRDQVDRLLQQQHQPVRQQQHQPLRQQQPPPRPGQQQQQQQQQSQQQSRVPPQRLSNSPEMIDLTRSDSSDDDSDDIPPPAFSPKRRRLDPTTSNTDTNTTTNNEGQRFASVEAARAAAVQARQGSQQAVGNTATTTTTGAPTNRQVTHVRPVAASTAGASSGNAARRITPVSTNAAASRARTTTGQATNVRPTSHGGTIFIRLPPKSNPTTRMAKQSNSPPKPQPQATSKSSPLVITIDDSDDDDSRINLGPAAPTANTSVPSFAEAARLQRQLLDSLEVDISTAEQSPGGHHQPVQAAAAQAAVRGTKDWQPRAHPAAAVRGTTSGPEQPRGPARNDNDDHRKPAAIPQQRVVKQVARKSVKPTPKPAAKPAPKPAPKKPVPPAHKPSQARFTRSFSDDDESGDDDDDDDDWCMGNEKAPVDGTSLDSEQGVEPSSADDARATAEDTPLITSDDDDGELDRTSGQQQEKSTSMLPALHPLSPAAQQNAALGLAVTSGIDMFSAAPGPAARKKQRLNDTSATLTTPVKSATKTRRQKRNRTRPTRLIDEVSKHLQSPVTVKHASPDESNEDMMASVKHLESLEISPVTGLPVSRFTVFSPLNEDIIYDFQVDVEPSNIPGAGNGAFLTFVGARKLKPGVREEKTRIAGPPKDPFLQELDDITLSATGRDGLGLTMSIVNSEKSSSNNRFIGSKELFVESDYEPLPGTRFSSLSKHNGMIDIGRYGPFRAIDRKPEINFTCKNFIFSNEPAEWAFGVQEDYLGREQMIDITDDVTGKTHDLAMQHVPMHVNEVGHNEHLTQTVFARESDDRVVRYYLSVKDPMKHGQRIELLVDYNDKYEEIRERKGYGKRNLTQAVADDDDPTFRFERNFGLRKLLEDEINSKELEEKGNLKFQFQHFYDLLEFIECCIRRPISSLADRYLDGQIEGPTCMQWIALLRIQWLGPLLTAKLAFFEDAAKAQGNQFFPYVAMFGQCKEWIANMAWRSFDKFKNLSEKLVDCDGKNIREAVRMEIAEEMCWKLHRDIPAPFHKGIWCPIATNLKMQLSWLEKANKPVLWNNLLELASSAANDVRKAAANLKDNSRHLEFASIADAKTTKYGLDDSKLMHHDLFRHNLNVDKGRLASLCGMTGYTDAMMLTGEPLQEFTLPPKTRILVTKFSGFNPGNELSALPKSLEDCLKCRSVVNESWYIVWQVVHLVHAFAEEYVPCELFSLEEICLAAGVDEAVVQPAIDPGINEEGIVRETGQVPSPCKKPTSSKGIPTKVVAKVPKVARARSPTGDGPRLSRKCIDLGPPDDVLDGGWPPGWRKQLKERQSGTLVGKKDPYWITPEKQFKLRSMAEVKRFMVYMEEVGHDEQRAWAMLKRKNS